MGAAAADWLLVESSCVSFLLQYSACCRVQFHCSGSLASSLSVAGSGSLLPARFSFSIRVSSQLFPLPINSSSAISLLLFLCIHVHSWERKDNLLVVSVYYLGCNSPTNLVFLTPAGFCSDKICVFAGSSPLYPYHKHHYCLSFPSLLLSFSKKHREKKNVKLSFSCFS